MDASAISWQPVVADLSPRALNVHFEDRIENGELTFDYTMKEGPVTRSNALALMRAVGLDVDAGQGSSYQHDSQVGVYRE